MRKTDQCSVLIITDYIDIGTPLALIIAHGCGISAKAIEDTSLGSNIAFRPEVIISFASDPDDEAALVTRIRAIHTLSTTPIIAGLQGRSQIGREAILAGAIEVGSIDDLDGFVTIVQNVLNTVMQSKLIIETDTLPYRTMLAVQEALMAGVISPLKESLTNVLSALPATT